MFEKLKCAIFEAKGPLPDDLHTPTTRSNGYNISLGSKLDFLHSLQSYPVYNKEIQSGIKVLKK